MSKSPLKSHHKLFFKTDLPTLFKETKVIFYKSSGPGGQRKNKRETAIKLHHIPSGLWIVATEERSQARNRELAFRRLQKKLAQLNKRKKPRIPTQLPIAVREKILQKKKIRSEKKQLRKKVDIPIDF